MYFYFSSNKKTNTLEAQNKKPKNVKLENQRNNHIIKISATATVPREAKKPIELGATKRIYMLIWRMIKKEIIRRR